MHIQLFKIGLSFPRDVMTSIDLISRFSTLTKNYMTYIKTHDFSQTYLNFCCKNNMNKKQENSYSYRHIWFGSKTNLLRGKLLNVLYI